MLDLNDFLNVIKSGCLSKDNIMIARRDGVIVDYVLPQESVSENEVVEVMNLKDIISEIFGL